MIETVAKPKEATLIVPTHDDIVWAAGFFDGEGSCGIYKRKSRGKVVVWQYSATAAVSQSFVPTLVWHKERWGGWVTAPSYTLNPSMFTNKGSSFIFDEIKGLADE